MWDEHYTRSGYLYGIEPNDFLSQKSDILSGPVLSLAEGEGRNAVFLANLGLEVLGVDASEVGLRKAQELASKKGLRIETEIADLSVYEPKENFYGSVVSIYAHLPSKIRKNLYPLVEQSLKLGDVFLLEAYSERQIHRDTGGPKDIDQLLTCAELEQRFSNCDIILSQEIEREVIEGEFHTGLASVVQFIAQKNALQN